ncbi:hypothetical protein ACP70R_019136 [Stipagrostis hirtigluma subsp. patula]
MEDSVELACETQDDANAGFQIQGLKRTAYAAVLRAFCARSGILSGAKEACLNELRNELKILETEHREYLVNARSNKQSKSLSAGLSKGNISSTEVIPGFACGLPDAGETVFQIHCLERSAYASVLRTFCAMTNQLSLLQVKLLSKLRNELRISRSENKEVLVKVISDEHIKSLRKFSLANCSVPTKLDPAFDAHAVAHDKIASTGQGSTSSTSCLSLAQQSPISERSMSSARDIGILGSANRAKEGSCFEPHAVMSAKRLKSVNGHALAYIKCSPSAELPVAISVVMEKSRTDDTLVSETFSFEVKTGCTFPPVFHEKHSQSNAGHVPSCVDHDRKESGKRKPKEPVMRGSKNQRRRKQEKDSELDIGSEIIKLCLTANLLNKVEKIFRENPDPANLETAKSMLKVQEKELLDALIKLSEVSYGVAYLSTEGQLANLNKDDEEVPPKPASSSDETPPETRPGDGGAENNAKIQGVAAAAASPSATRPHAPASPLTAASTDMASSSEGDQPRLAPAGTQGAAPPGPGRGKVNRRWKPSTRVFGADWVSFG